MTPQQQSFELGMHSAFKKAGVKTREEAEALFKHAGDLLAQRQARAKTAAAYELGLRKVAADHGLLSVDEQDAFVEAARKVAAEKAAYQPVDPRIATQILGAAGVLGATGTGAGVGQAAGIFRAKDKDEGRLHAILRSQLTGTATGLGAGLGGVAGGLAGVKATLGGKARILAILAGAGLGGAGAFKATKRTPNPPGIMDQIKAKVTKKASILGLGGTTAGEDVGSIGKGIKGLVGKARTSIKDHPTISAAIAALLAGGVLGSRVQAQRDRNKLAALRFLADNAEGIKDKAKAGMTTAGDSLKALRDYVMGKLGK